MKIKISELKKLAKKVILKPGNISKDDADKVIDILLYADMTGRYTQGVIKLVGGQEALQDIKSKGPAKMIKETKVSAHYDSNGNPSPLVTKLGTDKAIEKCQETGIGIVGVTGIHSSNGTQAYYVREIAKKGFVGIALSRSPAAVAPNGGKEPMFGTNPIGFGFPTLDEPMIFDMATSAITWFGLVKAKADGKKIPDNVAIDKNGNVTTDPAKAMEGAILPFDRSYKGAGLSMMVEILGGPLVGAAFCTYDIGKDWGTLILAIDPEIFVGRKQFKKNVTELRDTVKKSPKRSKDEMVTIPGERSLNKYQKALQSGEVEISDGTYKELLKRLD